MIGASLTIIAIIVGLIAHHDVELRREQHRTHGIALSNAPSRISIDRLVPTDRHLGPLSLIQATELNSHFAYAVVASNSGKILEAISAEGIIPSQSSVPLDPSDWRSEKIIEVEGGRGKVHEFISPILEDGELVARVQIGLWEPGYGLVLESPSFHASVALLVFMIFPLAYFWLRREIRPLGEVARSLDTAEDGLQSGIDLSAPPSQIIAAIAFRFRTFCEEMEARSVSISRERVAMLASLKVVAHEKNRINLLLEAIPDAVLALDEMGKVTIANSRVESVLRTSRDDLVGSATSAWSPSTDLTRLIGRYSGSNGRLKRPESVEYSPDELGQRRYLASVLPLGEADGLAVVIREITQEFAARKTQAEFLAHMAHELKAPLNVMSMYSESLLGENAADETFRIDACNVIRDEIDRLNGLINNIFSIGRIQSGSVSLDRQMVRTREFLEDVFESISRGANELEIVFEIDLPDPMKPIYADKSLLSVAFKNLLTNAIKYNREGGKVSLIAEEQESGLLIRVIDTGVGIPDEDVGQVFEKFYRSEDDAVRKIAGHGLGLALVKEIIALHGGEIRVQSVLGEGSEFAFFFSREAALFQEEG